MPAETIPTPYRPHPSPRPQPRAMGASVCTPPNTTSNGWCSDFGSAGTVSPGSPAPPANQGIGPAKHGPQPADIACSDPGGSGPGGGP